MSKTDIIFRLHRALIVLSICKIYDSFDFYKLLILHEWYLICVGYFIRNMNADEVNGICYVI